LYVPGTLADTDNVIVDVGTGFYVEKVCSSPTEMMHVADVFAEHKRCYEILREQGGGAGRKPEGTGEDLAGEE
jgi:prefoldin subunit 5